MRTTTCTLAALLALLWVGACETQSHKHQAPEFLMEGRRRVLVGRDEIRVNVKAPPCNDLDTVRLEIWALAEVPWTMTLAHEPKASTEVPPEGDMRRWEPQGDGPIRSLDEPVTHGTNQSVYHFTIRGALGPGRYRLIAKSILANHVAITSKHHDFEIR